MNSENRNLVHEIGQPLDRVDGYLKVTGGARYAAEFNVAGLAYAALVQSTIANGKITAIDSQPALELSGVLAVITYQNLPSFPGPHVGQPHPALLVPEITYSGQHVAVVVADSVEQAQFAASRVKVSYESSASETDLESALSDAIDPYGRPMVYERGDSGSAAGSAAKKIDEVYRTPIEHHNPMEPHATVAIWDGDKLTIYDSTQGVSGTAQTVAAALGISPTSVHVIDPFVGGGFGCKGMSWPHTTLAAIAAKVVQRPVKLVLTRTNMFTSNGHRPQTRQAIVLGTGADGKLAAVEHRHVNGVSETDQFVERTGLLSTLLYSCPNVHVEHKIAKLNIGPPTYMRAPGESSGSFGLETAMDELAWELGIDPIDLRLRNYADRDESDDRPWSSKSLKQCYAQGAQAFGWSKRSPKVGGNRKNGVLVGYGMATACYPANFSQASARVRMYVDGTVLVQCGTQDLGTGTYTILSQIAADCLGAPIGRIQVELGDSTLPRAPGSGGSTSAASAGSAVKVAAEGLRAKLAELAQVPPDNLDLANPSLIASIGKTDAKFVEFEGTARPGPERGARQGSPSGSGSPQPANVQAYSMHAFGAQFCEVHVDEDLRTIRVARWVGAFGVGKVLNAKTLRSQLQGGIVFGIGMALTEETLYDPHFGRIVNSSLAEYHLPVNADSPLVETIVVDEFDPWVSPVGAKGAGEIGITGVAAAIGNAVYHATGKRVRDLPITLDKIM
jgi:xanthine dehydrogenase YagR molybdenum-binding subunit